MIRILVQEGEAERATHVIDRPSIRIGRDPSNDVIVRDRFVSSRHGELRMGPAGLTYEDFCTTNGSRVRRGGATLAVDASTGHVVSLQDGDELLLGDAQRPVRVQFELAAARVFGRRGVIAPPRVVEDAEVDVALGETMVLMQHAAGRDTLLALHGMTLRLGGASSSEEVLDAFSEAALATFARATHVAAFLLDPATGEYVPALSRSRKGKSDVRPVSKTVRDRVLAQGKALAFTDGEEGYDLAASLHDCSIRAGLCAPLFDGRGIRGLVQVDSRGARAPGAFTRRDLETLVLFAHQAAMALANARLREDLQRGAEQVVTGLVAALEAKDAFSAGHSQAVAGLCEATCLSLGLDPATTRTVRRAALVHDIGKIGIPYPILSKAGPLSPEEAEILRSHAEVGARILEPLEMLGELAPLVRHHHESWDGSGPHGLAGERIPLGARILAVCDTWDALVHDRPHRRGLTPDEARAQILAMSGSRLDPAIAAAFLELVADDDTVDEPCAADEPALAGSRA